MNNLTTLIKRLEAATSRLEDVAQATVDPSSATSGVPPNSTALKGLPGSAAGDAPSQPPTVQAEALPVSVGAFDEIMNTDIVKFVKYGEQIGGVLAEQSAGVMRAFGAQRKILLIATQATKPDVQSPLYMEILTELQRQMGSVGDLRETNRTSALANHLSAVSEGITALGWITIEPDPAKFVTDVFGGAHFFGNRVIKEYKERDRKHVDWIQSFYQIFKSLVRYVKEHHAAGLIWNKDGRDAREVMKDVHLGQSSTNAPVPQGSAGAGGSGAAPPPPPPPPPPPLPTLDSTAPGAQSKAQDGGDMDAVFAQLNQGEAVTATLRKVDKSEMTHRNPALRAGSIVPQRTSSQTSLSSVSRGKSPAPPGKKPKPESMRAKRPPRKELDGNKWIIENYESEPQAIQLSAQINQMILISRCRDVTVQISGKANAISIENSPGVSLIVDSLVSSVDVVKSSRFALQVFGVVPTVLLDQVDGATVYLAPTSLATEIFTSKCTGVNLNVPSGAGDGDEAADDVEDYNECALPEQIRSYVKKGKAVSEIVEHAG